jgi:hypothetical protein
MSQLESSSVAIFDPEAFYPFRRLVQGGLKIWSDLPLIEHFIRAIVLHDKMSMILAPTPYDPISDEEMRESFPGPRNVIVGIGPVLTDYKKLLSCGKLDHIVPESHISPAIIDLVGKFSNAGPGNPYYRAHIEFAGKILAVVRNGGSFVCEGRFSRAIEQSAREYPNKLFQNLDQDWQEFARATNSGQVGIKIPPILNIILSRCENREAIPDTLNQLRGEWADARTKTWRIIKELRMARTYKEAQKITRELSEASKHFSPFSNQMNISPVRILWDILLESANGAVNATLSGGEPVIGAAVAAGKKTISGVVKGGKQFGKILFGRGAFDLAKRIRKELLHSSPQDTLSKILAQSEKDALGL